MFVIVPHASVDSCEISCRSDTDVFDLAQTLRVGQHTDCTTQAMRMPCPYHSNDSTSGRFTLQSSKNVHTFRLSG